MPRPLLHASITTRYPPGADGYVRVRLDDGTITEEHRVVMAQALGRELEEGEIVKHLSEDRADNDISNLMLFDRKSAQARRVSLVCAGCGVPFSKAAKHVQAAQKRKQKHFYCTLTCVGRCFGRGKKNIEAN